MRERGEISGMGTLVVYGTILLAMVAVLLIFWSYARQRGNGGPDREQARGEAHEVE